LGGLYLDKIIISGQCSKVGKTKFIEETINNLCGKIFALKAAVSKDKEELTISVEKDAKNNEEKDTGRYLKAGAAKAAYLKSNLTDLAKGIDKIEKDIEKDYDYKIYEGNNVIDFVNPTIVIFLKNDNLENKYSADKAFRKADIIIDYSNDKRDIIFNKESMICYKAHLLADIMGISVGRIGKLLNKADIKIKGCQLGLF
jgi:molybdopterin-guanine dinucleotide biosynthesis protein